MATSLGGTRGHGQHARSPERIPLAGWKDVLGRLVGEIGEDRVMLIAAGVTYYLLLALVPMLTVFVSLYGLFADRATVNQHISLLVGVVPPGGIEIIKDQLDRLTSTGNATLNITLIVSIVVALWSASAGVKSLFEAMNIVYDETEKRNFIALQALGLLFTLLSVLAGVTLLGLVVGLPIIFDALYIGAGQKWLISIVSYLLMGVLMSLGIATLYRWGPSRREAKWRWLTPGSILAVLGIVVISVLFSWYAGNFGNYNATYGSLGALVGLLTWIWLTITMLLIGAELNSELEHQTSADSTVGAPKPMGTRGAYMADHVADIGPDATRDGKHGPSAAPARRPAENHIDWGRAAIVLPAAIAVSLLLSSRARRR